MIAFMPLAQTLFTVVEGTSRGRPAYITACRVGAWPTPALTTLPKKASSITVAGKFDLPTAALMAREARRGAVNMDNAPPNFPMGVRAIEIMTVSSSFKFEVIKVRADSDCDRLSNLLCFRNDLIITTNESI